MMSIFRRRRFLEIPSKVPHEERCSPLNSRQGIVIQDDDPSLAHQMPKVIKVNEDAVEAVVAIHKAKVELAIRLEKLGQDQLRSLGMEFNEWVDSRFLKYLKSAVGIGAFLKRVHRNMACVGVSVQKQALADVKRGEAVGQSLLSGSRLHLSPISEGLHLPWS